jgi:hypothetical protein
VVKLLLQRMPKKILPAVLLVNDSEQAFIGGEPRK